MLIAAVLTLCASVVTAALALWSLARIPAGDTDRQVLRAVAPTQLAGALMLAAGGVVALAAPAHVGVLMLVMCVVGAVGTVAAGCYQSAKAGERANALRATTADSCAGACASCTLSCG
jgi:uncharacterized membrane protein